MMANKREIVICGIKYKNVNDASKKTGISYSTLTNRIKKYGLDDSRVIETPKPQNKEIVICGVKYTSITDASKKIGISRKLLKQRIEEYGLNSPKILKKPKQREITICGVKYKNISDASKKLGIKRETLSRKIKKYGKDNPKILEKPESKEIIICGIKYASKADASRKIGIDERTLSKRIKKYGLDNPKILEKAQKAIQPKSITFDGICFKTIVDAYHHYFEISNKKLTESSFRQSIKEGCTTTREVDSKKDKKVPIVIDGIKYESITELAQAYDKAPIVLIDRYRKYKTVKRANVSLKDYLLLEGNARKKMVSEIFAHSTQSRQDESEKEILQSGFLTLKKVSELTGVDANVIYTALGNLKRGQNSTMFPDLLNYAVSKRVGQSHRIIFDKEVVDYIKQRSLIDLNKYAFIPNSNFRYVFKKDDLSVYSVNVKRNRIKKISIKNKAQSCTISISENNKVRISKAHLKDMLKYPEITDKNIVEVNKVKVSYPNLDLSNLQKHKRFDIKGNWHVGYYSEDLKKLILDTSKKRLAD